MGTPLYTVVSFLLGFLTFYKVSIVGTLGLNELLLIFLLPLWILPMSRALKIPAVRSITLLALVYLLGQILSDWYRLIPQADYLRGWAKIGITTLSIPFTFCLIDKGPRVVVAFLLGSSLSSVAGLLKYGPVFGEENVYKFHYGIAVSTAAFLIVAHAPERLKRAAGAFPIAAGLIAFFRDSRSMAGITLLAQLTGMFSSRPNPALYKRPDFMNTSMRKKILAGAGLAVVGYVLFTGYRLAAENGLLGEAARDKYYMQAEFRGAGEFTVLSGRMEIFFSWPKIMSSPIIGWGSWAKDSAFVYSRAADLGLNAQSFSNSYDPNQAGLIPAHSHILGGWLEAGIAGGIFWAVVFWRASRLMLTGAVDMSGYLAPLMRFVLLIFIWDLWFSPYGAERRVSDGFFIAWIVFVELQAGLAKSGSLGALPAPHPAQRTLWRPVAGRRHPQKAK